MTSRMVKAEVTLSGTGTGWTDTERLSILGKTGRILAVSARASAAGGTAAELFIAEATGDISSDPDDLDTFYDSGSLALTASSTEASLMDALPIPSPYAVDELGDIRVAANITAGSGTTTLLVAVYAEVWD